MGGVRGMRRVLGRVTRRGVYGCCGTGACVAAMRARMVDRGKGGTLGPCALYQQVLNMELNNIFRVTYTGPGAAGHVWQSTVDRIKGVRIISARGMIEFICDDNQNVRADKMEQAYLLGRHVWEGGRL